MKKYITIALILASLTLTACSNASDDTDNESIQNESVSDTTESESNGYDGPSNDSPVSFSELQLDGTPVYENGMLVLRFADSSVEYDADTICYIGVISADEAYSVKATPVLDAYADMAVSEGVYSGIALKPNEELSVGTFNFSITIGDSKVPSFDLTIE